MKTSYVIIEVRNKSGKLEPVRLFHHNGSRAVLSRYPDVETIGITLHDDDSLFDLAQRLEVYPPHVRANGLYFWTPDEALSSNIVYRRTAAPFEIDPVPGAVLKKRLPADRDLLLVRQDTTSRLLSGITEPIFVVSLPEYLAFLAANNVKDQKSFIWIYFDQQSVSMTKAQVTERQMTIDHNDEITALVEKSPAKPLESKIFEAVIHVNYNEERDPFINLEKIFTMAEITREQPFVRYRAERGILPKFKIYEELTDRNSPLFVPRSIMEDWMELNKNIDDERGLKSLANRGLSFKLFNYETADGKSKYMTVNIFPDGKVEIKAYWDEQVAADDRDIKKVITRVKRFIEGINELQYHLPGVKRTLCISVPDEANTRVSFFNRVATVKFNEPVNPEAFKSFLHQFIPYVAPMIKPLSETGIEIRYKRVADYTSQPAVFKFIRTFRETESVGLEKALMDVFYPFDQHMTKEVIKKYDNTVSTPEEPRKRKYHLVKQPGIDIKFTPVAESAGDVYRCLILGVNAEQLPAVSRFLGVAVEAYNMAIPIPVRSASRAAAPTAETRVVSVEDEEAVAFVPRTRGRKPAATAAEPVKKPSAAPKVIQNMLGYLRLADPSAYDKARYSTSRNDQVVYSRKCQKIHQPLVVSLAAKDLIEDTIKRELAAAETEIKETPAGKKHDRLEQQIKSLKYNKIGVDNGKVKGNRFFFCPFTWDWGNHNRMEAGKPPIFPIQNDDGAMSYTASIKPDQDPIFPSNLYAFESLPDESGKSHQGFCCKFREKKATATAAAQVPIVPASAPLERTINMRYVLDYTKVPAFNRWAELPPQINRLFNIDDTGYLIQDHSFVHGFNYYLRRGMRRGLASNSFLDALSEIYPKRDLLKELITKVSDVKFFKSLKQGSIYRLFLPAVSDADISEIEEHYPVKLVQDRFISWIRRFESSVNEDILWDFLTAPSTAFPDGINLIIIELDEVKCPVGFELSKLINMNRPTLVMYKSQDIYELICHVTYRHGDIKYDPIYNKSNPVSKSLLAAMNHECAPFENRELPAAAFQGRQRGVMAANGGYNLTETLRKLQLLPSNAGLPAFKKYTQIVDSYNKVVFLRVDNLWIPIEPSGIQHHLPIENLYSILDELPGIRDSVEFLLIMYLYGGFEGYQPESFLLRDKEAIGLVLKNGLILFCQPEDIESDGLNGSIVIKSSIAEHRFDLKSLVYGNMDYGDYWESVKLMEREYADFVNRGKRPVKQVDARWIYAVRQTFEQESYARLRYEISKFMQTRDGKGLRDEIMANLGKPDARTAISNLLTTATDMLVTSVETPEIKAAIGEQANYIRPSVRYECFNGKGRDDIHCTRGKLYIPHVNLVTGDDNNLSNYIQRLTEEIIRVPLKRNEILDDQVDNFTTGEYAAKPNEFYSDGSFILRDIDYLYSLNTGYLDKMSKQYQIVNPKRFKRDTANGKYRIDVLPEYWIKEFKSVDFRVYSKLGDNSYIFDQLDRALDAHTKIDLANFVTAMTDDEQTVIKAYYQSISDEKYTDLKTGILHPDHRMNQMDLMILSRIYNFKPVVLTDDSVRCLQTTQSVNDKYILFSLTLAGDYHIVKRGDNVLFGMFELPKVLFDICPADNRRVLEDLGASLERIAKDAEPAGATAEVAPQVPEPGRCQCTASTTGERCKNMVTDDPKKNRAYCDIHQYCNRRFDAPRKKYLRRKQIPEELIAIPDEERCRCIASTTHTRCKNRVTNGNYCDIHQNCLNNIDEPVKRKIKLVRKTNI
jgi:hypothetical protein